MSLKCECLSINYGVKSNNFAETCSVSTVFVQVNTKLISQGMLNSSKEAREVAPRAIPLRFTAPLYATT